MEEKIAFSLSVCRCLFIFNFFFPIRPKKRKKFSGVSLLFFLIYCQLCTRDGVMWEKLSVDKKQKKTLRNQLALCVYTVHGSLMASLGNIIICLIHLSHCPKPVASICYHFDIFRVVFFFLFGASANCVAKHLGEPFTHNKKRSFSLSLSLFSILYLATNKNRIPTLYWAYLWYLKWKRRNETEYTIVNCCKIKRLTYNWHGWNWICCLSLGLT